MFQNYMMLTRIAEILFYGTVGFGFFWVVWLQGSSFYTDLMMIVAWTIATAFMICRRNQVKEVGRVKVVGMIDALFFLVVSVIVLTQTYALTYHCFDVEYGCGVEYFLIVASICVALVYELIMKQARMK